MAIFAIGDLHLSDSGEKPMQGRKMAAQPTIDPVMAGHKGFSCKIGCAVGDRGGLWSVRDS